MKILIFKFHHPLIGKDSLRYLLTKKIFWLTNSDYISTRQKLKNTNEFGE